MRLLGGIVCELTKTRGRHGQNQVNAHVIHGDQVITAGKETHVVKCPILKTTGSYVTFGGNGHRPGRGYQIVGRTGKGWLHRAGYPFVKLPESPARLEMMAQFLDDLAGLCSDLDLTVVGNACEHETPRHTYTTHVW